MISYQFWLLLFTISLWVEAPRALAPTKMVMTAGAFTACLANLRFTPL